MSDDTTTVRGHDRAAPVVATAPGDRLRVAGRWAWVPVLVVGLLLFEVVRQAVGDTRNPNLVPALLLLGAAVVPVAFVSFIAGRRLPYGVSGGLIALTALVGGVLGVVAAGLLEYDTLRDLGVLPMVLVAVIEEAVKLIAPAVLVVALRHRLVAADGLLVGVAAGAGFAVLETMGYGFVALLQSRGDLSAVDDVLFERGVLSPAAHMAWTGLTAVALWRAATHGWHTRAVGGFLAGFAVAVALHTAWDSIGRTAAYVVLAVLSLGLLTWAAHRLETSPRALRAGGAVR